MDAGGDLTASPAPERNHQAHAPALLVGRPELDHPAALQGLERGQSQPHPGLRGCPPHPVVAHLDRERVPVAPDGDQHL